MTLSNSPGLKPNPPNDSKSPNNSIDNDGLRWSALYKALTSESLELSDSVISATCGGLAGVASGIVTCPLDVVKTRLQAQGSWRRRASVNRGHPLYSGFMKTVKTIWVEDRIRGMYRGLTPMIVGYLPTWATYMCLYDYSRSYYYTKFENKVLAQGCASLTAGACSTILTNPIWVVKTRLMSQVGLHAPAEARPPWQYRGMTDAIIKMYRSEGLQVFYSGLGPAMIGLSHVAIQFPLYEYLKFQFTGLELGQNPSNGDKGNHLIGMTAASFISKVTATSATYPHEVLRTRLQTQQRTSPSASHEEIAFRGGLGHTNHSRGPGTASSDGMLNLPRYRGTIQTLRVILAEEGWRAFYNGMGTNLMRAVPAAMTTFIVYENLRGWMHQLQDDGRLLQKADTALREGKPFST